jgi:hypothetical protein
VDSQNEQNEISYGLPKPESLNYPPEQDMRLVDPLPLDPAERPHIIVEPEVATGGLKRILNTLGRYKTKIAIGVTALSIGSTLLTDPLDKLTHEVLKSAPIIGIGLGVGEAAWIGGAAMMLASVGEHIKNPLRIKKEIGSIATKANGSRLFRAGFWINTIAAVTEFGVITTGIVTELPPAAWGWLSLGFADLVATVAVRKLIHTGIKNNLDPEAESNSPVAG